MASTVLLGNEALHCVLIRMIWRGCLQENDVVLTRQHLYAFIGRPVVENNEMCYAKRAIVFEERGNVKFSVPHYASNHYFIMFGGECRWPTDLANSKPEDDRAQRELNEI